MPILIGVAGGHVIDVALSDRMNRLIRDGSRATALSMKNFVRGAIQLCVPAAYGILFLHMGIAPVMAIIGIVVVVAGLFVAWKARAAYANARTAS